MAEDQSCDLPPPTNTHAKKMMKKKRKKRKKNTDSTSAHKHTDISISLKNTTSVKPQTASLPPETASVPPLPPPCPDRPRHQLPKLRASSRKNGGRASSKKRLKDSPADKTSGAEAPVGGGSVPELSAQARESLRWEGVLEDPQAEERRLEAYRANRRQRYLAHREALVQEMQTALRKNVS